MTPTEPTSSNFWDNVWKHDIKRAVPGLDAPTWNNQIDARKIQLLHQYLPSAGVAVEVGCGSARLLARIGRSAKLSLVGIDSAPTALKLALQAADTFDLKMDVINADVHGLPLETETVHIVLSGGLLEHFPDPRPVLAEMVRILHVGGVFYADVVPRKGSLYRLKEVPRMWVSEWLRPGVYESTYGPQEYEAWLTELGCTDIRIEYCGVYPKMIRWLPASVRRSLASLLQKLDGTAVANALGWYFIIVARKGRSPRTNNGM
jgi:ubiquinone/menaquinone biosynthesis C-methylase UbiE